MLVDDSQVTDNTITTEFEVRVRQECYENELTITNTVPDQVFVFGPTT